MCPTDCRTFAGSTCRRSWILLAAACGILAWAVPCAGETPSVAWSGFMDVLFTTDHDDPATGDFALGQAELDIDAETSAFTAVSVAVAYDADAEVFGLGAAVMDLRLLGDPADHWRASDTFTNAGVIIGQFDVPLGIDWLVYPSLDRQLVSSPLAVLGTHDQWNDLGLLVYGEAEAFNIAAWLTDGFGREGVDPLDQPVALDVARSGGARAGFLPTAYLELGASAALLGGADPDQSQTLWGVDAQAVAGPWEFKGEYLSHEVHFTDDYAPVNTGWYAQGLRRFGDFHLVTRYDRFTPEEAGLVDLERLSLAAGLTVFEAAVVRCEYLAGLSDDLDDTWVLQWAAGF